jgi:hypothetical protein
MEIIMPCAGRSTRFPDMRPKYLLTDYSGELMIKKAAKNFIGKHKITIIILKEHDYHHRAYQKVNEAFDGKVRIIVLDKDTDGPAHTAYIGIKKAEIDPDSSILIKDCDGFYETDLVEGNAIYVSKLSDNPNIRNAPAKSYTLSNEQRIINTVVEKQIVSNHFCAGGYQFARAGNYCEAYENLKFGGEIFVSNIIDKMISDGKIFVEADVQNFIDVGTAQDWFEYNNKPTYFCDIDGTIIETLQDYYDDYTPLRSNIDAIKREIGRGSKVIFCTARSKEFETITRLMLNDLGFKSCELIMNVHHSKRILINDFANTNRFPTASAINLPRDSDTLKDYL